MAVARIAAVAFAAIAVALTAQTAQLAQPAHLSIKVTDTLGTIIPGARIQIDRSPPETRIDATADRNGEAAFDLSPGHHVVSISATGFKRLDQEIEIKNGSDRRFTALLFAVDTAGDLNVVAEDKEARIPLEHQPFAAAIPFVPTQQFPPPSRRLHLHLHRL